MKSNELMLPPTRWGFRLGIILSIGIAFAAGYLLFAGDDSLAKLKVLVLGERDGIRPLAWLDTDRPARLRKAGVDQWENAPKNTEVREGDRVFIPEGGRGSVVFYGPAGSKGRERSVTLGANRVYQIVFTSDGRSDLVAIGAAAGEGALALSLLAQREYTWDEIEKSAQDLFTRWRAFQSRSTERGKLKALGGGSVKLDRVGDYEVRVSMTPPAVKPGEGATLAWSGVPLPGVSYSLQVAGDPSFKGAMKHKIAETQSPVNFKREGKYFVRVIASRGKEAIVSDVIAVDVAGEEKPADKPVGEPAPPPKAEAKAVPPPAVKAPSVAKATPPPRAPKRVATPTASRKNTEVPAAPESLGSDLNGFTAEVASDSQFRDIVASALTTEARCPREGLPAGTYYCRLTPIQGEQTPRTSKFVVKGE